MDRTGSYRLQYGNKELWDGKLSVVVAVFSLFLLEIVKPRLVLSI
jgi:hypothetical protein